jgi:hypothetical protein
MQPEARQVHSARPGCDVKPGEDALELTGMIGRHPPLIAALVKKLETLVAEAQGH